MSEPLIPGPLIPGPLIPGPLIHEKMLYEKFQKYGVVWEGHEHDPVITVQENQMKNQEIAGLYIKNLFLRDKKRRFFLLSTAAERVIDLKQLRHIVGASGNFSFGDTQSLHRFLGVLPGAVNPFAVMCDSENRVQLLFDKSLIDADYINAHPMRNDRSVALRSDALMDFVCRENHPPYIIDFDQDSPKRVKI